MAGSDLTPGDWPITITQGDTLPEDTITIQADGVDVTLSRSLAQVRRAPNSPVLLTLTTSESGGDVTFGGDTVTLDPGAYQWDMETESTELGVLTVLSGGFRVLAGVSEEP